MNKSLAAFLFVYFLAVFSINAQTTKEQNLLKELLELPAPPSVIPVRETAASERPPEFFSDKNIPPDDAPIEDLLDYWRAKNADFDEFRYNLRPSKESLERIVEALKDNPDEIQNFLKILPPNEDTIGLVKNYYEKQMRGDASEYYRLDSVRQWLRKNSDMFVGELVQSAQELRMEGVYLQHQEDFEALAVVAWDQAKPFVDRFESNRTEIEKYTLAKFVLYLRAMREGNFSEAESHRDELKKIVEDKELSYKARDLAMDAIVLGGDYDGRTDWYLSLLKDETLLELQENGFTGLTTLPRHLPTSREDWLPSMIKLIENGTPAERTAAIRNLIKIRGENDAEVLKLLLPWLTDKNWAKESDDNEREELVDALGEIIIPEAIPGLIAVITNEKEGIRASAAAAIGKYDAPQAIPALRAALREEEDYESRENFIAALINLKGFSVEEQVAALEIFAAHTVKERIAEESDEEYDEEEEETIPVEISVGSYLSRMEEPGDILILRVIERIKILQRTNPLVAAELSEILQKWKSRVVDLEMLGWVKMGNADITTILKLLTNRKDLQKRVPSELSAMRTIDGLPRGLSAVIAEDQTEIFSILKKADATTQIAALSGARLLRIPIPVADVAPLLSSQNKLLALAAERYLEAEDSPQARNLILSKFPDEVRILGARKMFIANEEKDFAALHTPLTELFQSVNGTRFFPGNDTEIIKTEKNLRDEMKQNPELQAVFALVEDKTDGQMVVRLFKDKIVFTNYEDEARYRERRLSPEEYEAFYRFLIDSQIDTHQPPGNICFDCSTTEFLMFGRTGGRRVFVQTLYSIIKVQPFDKLYEFFESFNSGDLKLHYRLSDKLKGLEVLLADENYTARSVWKNGGDFRVLVEDNEKKFSIMEELMNIAKTENAVINADRNQLRETQNERRRQSLYQHFSWRKIENGKMSAAQTAQPAGILYLENPFHQRRMYIYMPEDPAPTNWNKIVGGFEYHTSSSYSGSIVKFNQAGAETVIKEGEYRNPFVSADGRWIIAYKSMDEGADKLVRINAQTGKEFFISTIPPADIINPQAFVPSLYKFLIVRSSSPYSRGKNNPGPKTPEFYLLDPQTGAAQIARGEIRPLLQQTYRGLQPTGNPSEFWAAIYNEEKKATEIGRYSDKTLTFKPVLEIPEIALDSMNIWVDEAESKVYFVYQGHLLALPLIKAK